MPDNNPIEHLIILMMENRSFDHFFGKLPEDPVQPVMVEGLPASLPKPVMADDGVTPVLPWAMDGKYIYPDLPHDPVSQQANYAAEAFVKNYQNVLRSDSQHPDPSITTGLGGIPMGYYTRQTLPVLYSLAGNFCVCDHWFSSMLSSTWPNRKYLNSGTRDAAGDTHTLPSLPGFETRPLYDALEDTRDPFGNKLTWKSYFTDLPFLAFWYKFAAFHAFTNFRRIDEFVKDCREDTLPTVSLIDPPFSLADDHPTHDVRLGQKFIGLIVDALTHSESWNKSALVILYDENGGFYDHVEPPQPFEQQNGLPPEWGDTPLGFRVPAVVISPYARKGACSTVFDHTSILKSIHTRWGVDFSDPAFGTRWPFAPDIWSTCLDFNQAPIPAGTYTQPPADVASGAPPAFSNLSWQDGVQELMANEIGDLEALLERIFLLPELKLLDNRSSVFDTLVKVEQAVQQLKSYS